MLTVVVHLPAHAQDMVVMKTRDTLRAKVLSVTPDLVTCSKTGSGGNVSVVHERIARIIYENGTQDIFSKERAEDSMYSVNSAYSSLAYEQMGRDDAHLFYRGYHDSRTAMIISSALAPGYSLIPAAVVSSTRPKEYNLGYPYPELMRNEDYRFSYENEAFRIKRNKTWGGVLIGTGIVAGIYALAIGLLAAAYSSH